MLLCVRQSPPPFTSAVAPPVQVHHTDLLSPALSSAQILGPSIVSGYLCTSNSRLLLVQTSVGLGAERNS